jgi:hypothetical protein
MTLTRAAAFSLSLAFQPFRKRFIANGIENVLHMEVAVNASRALFFAAQDGDVIAMCWELKKEADVNYLHLGG